MSVWNDTHCYTIAHYNIHKWLWCTTTKFILRSFHAQNVSRTKLSHGDFKISWDPNFSLGYYEVLVRSFRAGILHFACWPSFTARYRKGTKLTVSLKSKILSYHIRGGYEFIRWGQPLPQILISLTNDLIEANYGPCSSLRLIKLLHPSWYVNNFWPPEQKKIKSVLRVESSFLCRGTTSNSHSLGGGGSI